MAIELKNRIKKLTPDSLLLGQLVLRRASAWRQAGLIFVHVPKNGGTSINTALYGRFMGHYRVRDIERVRPDLLRALPSVAVTRNPWARAYSAWGFARKGAQMTDGVQIDHAARYRCAEFASFERFVMEWLPQRNLERENYVFRPQTQFLLNRAGEIGVTHLGRLEDTGSFLPVLEERLGLGLEIKHLNRSTDPFRYREVYTPQMRDMLYRCYTADFEKFAYDF